MENQALYEVDGNMGKILKVYEDRCVISTTPGIKSFAFGSLLNGDKEFYYKDLTSVQFKNLGLTTGFLQFEYAGSHSGSNFVSENSFTFSATAGSKKYYKLKEDMPLIYEDIRERINQAKNNLNVTTVTTSLSPAEELKKFKELLDEGIITQAEFEAKKHQLLDL